MALQEIPYSRNLERTLDRMTKGGLLLTSAGPDGRPNVMTIGWATPGIIWGRQIFTVLVRPSRYTFGNIEATGEFAVCVPTAEMRDVCMYCGSNSGRDTNKFEGADLIPIEAAMIGAPLIEQCVRHYECRVVHCNDVLDAALDPEVRAECYPGGDLHRVYHGQILRVTETE
jgi:flavin reductase (DIM6/NTAB) family NADH-FMN oxidoreductase RutF